MINSEIQNRIFQLFKNHTLNKKGYLCEIVKLYNAEMNQEYDSEMLSIEQEEEIQKWLYLSKVFMLELKHETYQKKDWFRNEFDKIQHLNQFHCRVCEIEGLTLFPIRITPKSHQVKSELKNKFQKLLKSAPYVKNKQSRFVESDRICLKLIFVIKESHDKDVTTWLKLRLMVYKEY